MIEGTTNFLPVVHFIPTCFNCFHPKRLKKKKKNQCYIQEQVLVIIGHYIQGYLRNLGKIIWQEKHLNVSYKVLRKKIIRNKR